MGGHLSSLEVDVEDVASVLLDVGRGSRQVPVHIALDYVQRPPQRTCEVVADQGKLVLDLRAGTLSIFGAAGETIERHDLAGFERNQMFLDEMSRFLACVEEGMTPPVDIREGVASLRVALAARRSLSTGEAVGIPEGDEWTES
jgi:predicted dehydrogenase